MADRHKLVERASVEVLPEMWTAGSRFDLIFLDGWKTFDHVWVDTFYCARTLEVGGHIMFDDARMAAVRNCISILERYCVFKKLDSYAPVGVWRQRLWHLMTNRTLLPPYVVLSKTCEIPKLPQAANSTIGAIGSKSHAMMEDKQSVAPFPQACTRGLRLP